MGKGQSRTSEEDGLGGYTGSREYYHYPSPLRFRSQRCADGLRARSPAEGKE
jgi:hypothetical protein